MLCRKNFNTMIRYLKWVHDCYDDIGCDNRHLFFRGHADKTWKLLPSVFRKSIYNERDIVLDYKQVIDVELNYIENLERILIRMQHHRIPTRLLDWSTGPLQALYFACSDMDAMDKDGAVMAINPWNNWKSCSDERKKKKPRCYFELMKHARMCLALGWSVDEIADYLLDLYDYKITSDELERPQPIVGRYMDPRVADQQGMFMIWGTDNRPIESQERYNGHIERFIIPADRKASILSELSKLGFNEFTIFRDHEGFKKTIDTTGSIFKIS